MRARSAARWLRERPRGLAAWCVVAVFLVMVARFWHPYYGFTRFIQLDAESARVAVHEMRDARIYVYGGDVGGYDGIFYAELAYHPLLDSPELPGAIDNVSYRARRILGSALAWALAGGDPADIGNVYASLNIVVWLALAALLWRLLPVRNWRAWFAWAGILFSAGALHSVRLALTDLLALTGIVLALLCAERGRNSSSIGAIAAAALARETSILAVVGAWLEVRRTPRDWLRNVALAVLAALPLIAWLFYVRMRVGAGAAGFGNLGWPFAAWMEKWREIVRGFHDAHYPWLVTTTLLATIGLTVQAAFFFWRPQWRERWWRLGAIYVVLMAFLGAAVWTGHPGAATRVLLPMSLAFSLGVVRRRAAIAWLLAGNLTLFAGVEIFRVVPREQDELTAGRTRGAAYTARIDAGFFARENDGRNEWAWSGGHGEMEIKLANDPDTPLRARMRLRNLSGGAVTVHDAHGTPVWSDSVSREGWPTVEFALPPARNGVVRLVFESVEPAVPESAAADARRLAFGVMNFQIVR